MRCYSFVLCSFLFMMLVDVVEPAASIRFEELREEDIIGLEEFLESLQPDTRDVVLSLLDAKQIPDQEASNRQLKKIMRKLPRKTQEELFNLYLQTKPE